MTTITITITNNTDYSITATGNSVPPTTYVIAPRSDNSSMNFTIDEDTQATVQFSSSICNNFSQFNVTNGNKFVITNYPKDKDDVLIKQYESSDSLIFLQKQILEVDPATKQTQGIYKYKIHIKNTSDWEIKVQVKQQFSSHQSIPIQDMPDKKKI